MNKTKGLKVRYIGIKEAMEGSIGGRNADN